MYPSGVWRGYWEQAGYGRQPMTDFLLRFANGEVEGCGRDIVGRFLFTGTYDSNGNVTLVKQYLGRHQVIYRGRYDGEGTIHGIWSIEPFWQGTFALSPVWDRDVTTQPIDEICG